MELDYVAAIRSLVPNAEFAIMGDLEEIVWHSEGQPPTKTAIKAELKRLQETAAAEAAAKAAQREAVLAALAAAAGLEIEEVKAVLA